MVAGIVLAGSRVLVGSARQREMDAHVLAETQAHLVRPGARNPLRPHADDVLPRVRPGHAHARLVRRLRVPPHAVGTRPWRLIWVDLFGLVASRGSAEDRAVGVRVDAVHARVVSAWARPVARLPLRPRAGADAERGPRADGRRQVVGRGVREVVARHVADLEPDHRRGRGGHHRVVRGVLSGPGVDGGRVDHLRALRRPAAPRAQARPRPDRRRVRLPGHLVCCRSGRDRELHGAAPIPQADLHAEAAAQLLPPPRLQPRVGLHRLAARWRGRERGDGHLRRHPRLAAAEGVARRVGDGRAGAVAQGLRRPVRLGPRVGRALPRLRRPVQRALKSRGLRRAAHGRGGVHRAPERVGAASACGRLGQRSAHVAPGAA
mmetsp:Transcript_34985/g.105652  ORF Transcript_34985/g.105652 Transcript_34985/m.105652 type:complete len:377 (+) Transcript_34985:305-1435(+)